jgi:hypothetical protein
VGRVRQSAGYRIGPDGLCSRRISIWHPRDIANATGTIRVERSAHASSHVRGQVLKRIERRESDPSVVSNVEAGRDQCVERASGRGGMPRGYDRSEHGRCCNGNVSAFGKRLAGEGCAPGITDAFERAQDRHARLSFFLRGVRLDQPVDCARSDDAQPRNRDLAPYVIVRGESVDEPASLGGGGRLDGHVESMVVR